MLRPALKSLVYSNVFIAIAACAQLIFNTSVTGRDYNPYLIVFIFFSTIVAYLFAVGYPKNGKNSKHFSERINWMNKNALFCHLLFFTSSIAVAFIFFKIENHLLIILIGVLALSYNLPFKVFRERSIRSLPGIKIVIISMVWAGSTLLTTVMTDNNVIKNSDLWRALSRFLWIIGLTIPFDIRDMNTDKQWGIKTIPILIGKSYSYSLSIFLLIISPFILIPAEGGLAELLSVGITSILSIIIIERTKKASSDMDYLLKLDGMLILQVLIYFSILKVEFFHQILF